MDDSSLPSRQDLAALPLWARVAFGVRCARRVQPLLQVRARLPGENIERIDKVLGLIERSCAEGAPAPGLEQKLSGRSYPRLSSCSLAAIGAAEAAQEAIRAAAAVAGLNAPRRMIQERAGEMATVAPLAAAKSAFEAVVHFESDAEVPGIQEEPRVQAVLGAMRRDFDLLREAALRENWPESRPVPAHFFPALWPEGPPPGWPAVPGGREPVSEACELVIEIEVPFSASEHEITKKICELADSADSVHRAYGGHGLKNSSVEIVEESSAQRGTPQ